MKTIYSAWIVILLMSTSQAFAARQLACELVDLSRDVVLDRKEATVGPGPILLLFSHGLLTGTVRDVATESPQDRDLQLQLFHRSGVEEGISRSAAFYRTDQALGESPLAEATLEEPTFRRPISLRCHLKDSTSVSLLATISYESGFGTANGFCDKISSWFCVDQIKRRAKDQATRDAQWRCELKKGRADVFSATCFENCNPFTIPDDGRSHFVTCSSNCNVRCEVP